jgi:CheY-like chemotaxis protein
LTGNPVIIVAEDDHDIAQVMAAALSTELSAHVLVALNGRRLLELAANIRPAVVVTDIRMPEVDGLVAAARLRDDPRTTHTPIVVVSAVDDDRAAIEAGGWVFLRKPFELDELVEVVSDLLRLHLGDAAVPARGRSAARYRPAGGVPGSGAAPEA